MNFLKHLQNIDDIIKKAEHEKKKEELFGAKKESAEELYIKSCGVDEEDNK
ncbi:MAG: hypothetical protein J6A58_05550 [Oscillospiraceae bacterium]|jgi:hypothetical protein|nr:hypothetical protein [Oscillospiraceae bacterium]